MIKASNAGLVRLKKMAFGETLVMGTVGRGLGSHLVIYIHVYISNKGLSWYEYVIH